MSEATAPRQRKTAVSLEDKMYLTFKKHVNSVARSVQHRYTTRIRQLEEHIETLNCSLDYYRNYCLFFVHPCNETYPQNQTSFTVKDTEEKSPESLTDFSTGNEHETFLVNENVRTLESDIPNLTVKPSIYPSIEPDTSNCHQKDIQTSPFNDTEIITVTDTTENVIVTDITDKRYRFTKIEEVPIYFPLRFKYEPEILEVLQRIDPSLTELSKLPITLQHVDDLICDIIDTIDDTEKPLSNRKLKAIITAITGRLESKRIKTLQTYFQNFAKCYYALHVKECAPTSPR